MNELQSCCIRFVFSGPTWKWLQSSHVTRGWKVRLGRNKNIKPQYFFKAATVKCITADPVFNSRVTQGWHWKVDNVNGMLNKRKVANLRELLLILWPTCHSCPWSQSQPSCEWAEKVTCIRTFQARNTSQRLQIPCFAPSNM